MVSDEKINRRGPLQLGPSSLYTVLRTRSRGADRCRGRRDSFIRLQNKSSFRFRVTRLRSCVRFAAGCLKLSARPGCGPRGNPSTGCRPVGCLDGVAGADHLRHGLQCPVAKSADPSMRELVMMPSPQRSCGRRSGHQKFDRNELCEGLIRSSLRPG
jgi:hypothetical protein